ncbi:protein NO VEIN domain-containing protein [Micromonospora sp. NPDC003241]
MNRFFYDEDHIRLATDLGFDRSRGAHVSNAKASGISRSPSVLGPSGPNVASAKSAASQGELGDGAAGFRIVTRSSAVRPSAQGRQADAATNRAIEIYAEDLAIEYFKKLGWSVARVGHLKLGFDLDCMHPTEGALHVEVKGTQGLGERVTLTPNEVRHTQATQACRAQHALYVVAGIGVDTGAEPIRCFGGRERCLRPWLIDSALLTPTQYAYTVPG